MTDNSQRYSESTEIWRNSICNVPAHKIGYHGRSSEYTGNDDKQTKRNRN